MVYILLAPGFEETEALVPADLLRRAGIATALTGVEGEEITGGHQITVKADMTLEQVNLAQAEMLVLPGGGEGVRNLRAHPAVAALVQEGVDRGIPVAAICAGPTLLGRWGHLRGRRAVCYPGLEGELLGAHPDPDAQVVQDGPFITGQGAGSAIPFGLKLIEVLSGADKAQEVCHAIHYR